MPTPKKIKKPATPDFWQSRFTLNIRAALPYQWQRYEEAGTIDNFRIAAGKKKGQRRGFFYTDSDLHKWADAAARALAVKPDKKLAALLAEYITIVKKAREKDGYLFTFNQIHFPGTRWKNLQIEHELYCMGHFIEAGVSHYLATGSRELLDIVIVTANLIAARFAKATPRETPGHQEIELALLRLYTVTGTRSYLETAARFLEMRGRMKLPGLNLLREYRSHNSRMKTVRRQLGEQNKGAGFDFTETLQKVEPRFMKLRATLAFLSGRYQQQHKPLKKQKEPTGHAVRWMYQHIAQTMLAADSPDSRLLKAEEQIWQRLTERHMFVTGGTGALPVIEGFGRPWQLDNRFAYCETCAAIGNIFWNNALLSATGNPRYADQMEWLMYNAAAAGIGLDGTSYFYRNPLYSEGELARRPWYNTACCPSNISRLWGSLPSFSVRRDDDGLCIDQYISGTTKFAKTATVTIQSDLPWNGSCVITLSGVTAPLQLRLRIPSWAGRSSVRYGRNKPEIVRVKTEGGVFGPELFNRAEYHVLTIPAGRDTEIRCDFQMNIQRLNTHPAVPDGRGTVTLTRGPLVYCVETADNPGLDVTMPSPLTGPEHYGYRHDICGGTGTIVSKTTDGTDMVFVPYCVWGNREAGSMRVMLPWR